jgi:hypothetical protein
VGQLSLCNNRESKITILEKAYSHYLADRSTCLQPNEFGIFMPSPLDEVTRILERAGAGNGQSFIDLGSGDGRVVLLAALGFGMIAAGYEVMEHYYQESLTMADNLGVQNEVKFSRDYLSRAPIGEYDLVYYFDGGSFSTRYRNPQNAPIYFFSYLGTMREGAKLVVAYSQRLHEHIARFPCLDLIESIPTNPRYPDSKVYRRNNCPKPTTWDAVFPSHLRSDNIHQSRK